MIDQIEFETKSETNSLKTHNLIAQKIGKKGETNKNKVIIITMIILLSVIKKAKLKITLIIIIFIHGYYHQHYCIIILSCYISCCVLLLLVFARNLNIHFPLLLAFFVFHFAQQFIGLLFQLINHLCLHNVSLLPSKTFRCRIDVIDSFPDQICQDKSKHTFKGMPDRQVW